jgi:hypothetical protein
MDILPEYLPYYDIEEIRSQPVVKNNGVCFTGLMILIKGESTAPNVYVDYYYSLYSQGKSLDDIVSDIARDYEEARKRMSASGVDEFNPKAMRDNIYMVLVNYEKNKKNLENCPYLPFLDLAVMFRYVVSEQENCMATGLVRNVEQELWGMTTQELYESAVKNTKKKFPMELMKLTDKMQELRPDDKFVPECNLYVLTNRLNSNGSIYMTDKAALEDFAESQDSNFYIIPSSIHEVLFFPDDGSLTREQLLDMLSDVNRYVLSDMEYLSDSIYYYDRSKKQITY